MSKFYTIAVQRWPFPWMTKHYAVDHFWSEDEFKLTIVCEDGSAVSYPRMDRRRVKIHGDIRAFKETFHVENELIQADESVEH